MVLRSTAIHCKLGGFSFPALHMGHCEDIASAGDEREVKRHSRKHIKRVKCAAG